jgi:hypothetical protein
MLSILHIAPQNFAGVPYDYYRMHAACGDRSRLITMHENPLDFTEDICLKLPLPQGKFATRWRLNKAETGNSTAATAPFFQPRNFLEKIYFQLEDAKRNKNVFDTIAKYDLDSFDIIHFDGGLDFFRDSRMAKRWKMMGKKIVCCYYGSDLRMRGILREMDELADLNITSEYDHLALKPGIEYVFYPFDPKELPHTIQNETGVVRIIHTPTNRKYKGTEIIIKTIEKIKRHRDIEFILLEKMPRKMVLDVKRTCDICIDQVGGSMGGTGYGKAGIETLAMGIPVISNFTAEYEAWLEENPFIVANDGNMLFDELMRLIDDKEWRRTCGKAGKEWVKKYHGYEPVNSRLIELYKAKGII